MINIIEQPPFMVPLYTGFDTVLDSTLKSKSNFSYIVNLDVNGQGVTELKVPSNFYGYGVFRLNEHLNNFIKSDFLPTQMNWFRAPGSFITYSISLEEQFRENWNFTTINNDGGNVRFVGTQSHYFNVGENIIVNGNLTNLNYLGAATITGISASSITINKLFGGTYSETGNIQLSNFELTKISSTASYTTVKWGWRGILDYEGFINWDWTKWVIGSNLSNMLTEVPPHYELNIGDDMWLASFNTVDLNRNALRIETNKGVYHKVCPFTASSTNDLDRFLYVGCGPNNILNGTYSVISGSAVPFDATSLTYSIWIVGFSNQQISRKYNFKINRDCYSYEDYQLIFLDRMGSYIPFRFKLKSKRNVSIERGTYNKNMGTWNNGGYDYATWDRGNSDFNIIGDEIISLNSDWINQAQSDYLVQMVMSPEVYVKIGGNYYSCVIINGSYEKKKRWDGLISINIEIKLNKIIGNK